ncbi:hypothetical protein ACGFOU_09675 [Streptomyces sp. NPDC048595]|uniref:hypothetical protein n=1 Tax=Streptomyces sp. NPDC048595 TaxID=3365576 RepID=UPI00371713A8
MGIESEQLVFDYLSRVGDLAQQRGLPSSTRMRLVSGLRAEIDSRQIGSASGVRRLLARLGTPEAVVAAAQGADDGPPGAFGRGTNPRPGPERGSAPGGGSAPDDGPAVPIGLRPAEPPRPPRTAGGSRLWSGARDRLGELVSRGGPTDKAAAAGHDAGGPLPSPRDGSADPSASASVTSSSPPAAPTAGLPPHLAGADELGDAQDAPDWWRVEPAPFGPGETVPGFVGGIEIPEIWDRPKSGADGDGGGSDGDGGPLSLKKDGTAGAGGDRTPNAEEEAEPDGRRPLPALLRRALARRRGAAADEEAAAGETGGEEEAGGGPVPLRAWLSPVPTLAVLLLVAGAVLGSWLALAGGWALAYLSRRLTPAEAKFAALGLPGLVAAGLVVWLWGRFDGRWGDPIARGHLGTELLAGLPAMARTAAVASALFLVWRMRRAAR